ncbi:MAG: hypothetical protein WAL63_00385 [Solirubrobacteraceae bacterium]
MAAVALTGALCLRLTTRAGRDGLLAEVAPTTKPNSSANPATTSSAPPRRRR